MAKNNVVRFLHRPDGRPDPSIFAVEEETIPPVTEGAFLLRNNYLSMDPALVSRMRDEDNYTEQVKNDWSYDAAISYRGKSIDDLSRDIGTACPDGVDLYYDNTSGDISEAVLDHYNMFARSLVIGRLAISHLMDTRDDVGRRENNAILTHRIRKEGFVLFDYQNRLMGAFVQLAKWVRNGELRTKEDIMEGIENAPKAFRDPLMRILLIPLLFIAIGSLIVFAAGPALQMPESTADFQLWLRGFDEWAWAAGAGAIIGDALLPLPSDPAIFTLGLIYGGLLGGLIGGTAATIAGLIGYSIARSLGEKGATFLVGEEDLARAEHFYGRWGFAAVAFGRAIGGPAEYLVVVAGLTDMPFRRVLLAIVTGAYSAAFCMAALGAYSMTDPTAAIILAVALVVVLIGAFHLLRRHHDSRVAEED